MEESSPATALYYHLTHWSTTCVLLLCGLAYLYFKHKFGYWARLGLRTPTPIPWFGTSLWPLFTPKPLLELEHHRKLGKLYGLYDGFLGTTPTLVCGHPEVLKQVTIKHFESFTNRRRPATWRSIRYRALTYLRDDEWKNLRKILAPTFTSNKLKKMYELMKRCTNNLQRSIDQQAEAEVDLKKLFSVFTVDVISTCCFSMDLKDYRHPDSEILTSARKFFNVSRLKMAFSLAIPKQLLALCNFDINDTTSIDFFARFATEIINKRRKLSASASGSASATASSSSSANANRDVSQQKKQDDFLQTLIDAAAEFSERKSADKIALAQPQPQQDVSAPRDNKQATATTTTTPTTPTLAPTTTTSPERQERRPSGVVTDEPPTLRRAPGGAADAEDAPRQERPHQQQLEPQLERPNEAQGTAGVYSEQQLGDLEILAQSMLFFAVGHETTATLLSSCGLFLALYPELQERLYREVSAAFADGKGELTYDTLLELQYLDAFISEALRFYTPTLTFDREASEDVLIETADYKFTIPKGMGVVIPFHAIHHDPDNYEHPERFDPDRFMPENRHNIKPCTFIPFGSGPRFCLASRFALVEAKLALANLVHSYRFVRSEGTIWPPKFRHHYMLLQMEWPKVRFVSRKAELSAGANLAAQMRAQIAA